MKKGIFSILIFFMFSTAASAQNLEPVNWYTATVEEGNGIWTELTVNSGTPFFAYEDESSITVFAHPNSDGLVTFEYVDITEIPGYSPDRYRFENASLEVVGTQPETTEGMDGIELPISNMNGTLIGRYRYSQKGFSDWEWDDPLTLESRIHINEPSLILQTERPDSSMQNLFSEKVSEVTDIIDYRNNTYHFNVGQGDGDDRVFASGLPVRMIFFGTHAPDHLQGVTLSDAGWATVDSNGDVSFGSGGNDVYIQAAGPTEKIQVEVSMSPDQHSAYLPYKGELPGNYRYFAGTLTIQVEDVCGNPISAKVRVRGGPIPGADAIEKWTENGEAKFVYGGDPDADSRHETIRILPTINLGATVTQVIDSPATHHIIGSKTVFLNGEVNLHSFADSFKDDDSFEDLILKFYENDALAYTESSFTVKRTWTDEDKRSGLERYKFPFVPTNEVVQYRVDAYMKDAKGEETLVGTTYQPISITAVPKKTTPLQFQYVPIERGKGSGNTMFLEQTADSFLPVPAEYRHTPGLAPRIRLELDAYLLARWFNDLENYRLSQSPPPDLVIGLAPSGGLNTFLGGKAAGLSMDSHKHVVLLDLSRTDIHHLIHEYMHTLGLADNYGGTFPPASANGYCEKGIRIWNAPGQDPLNCAVMYDFAPVAWPTAQEYRTLLNHLTHSPDQADGASKRFPVSTLRSQDSEKVLLVSGTIDRAGGEMTISHRSPLFVDDGFVFAPQEVEDGYFEAYGVRLVQNGQEVAKAYRSNNMKLNNGYEDFGTIEGMINFTLPWQPGIDTLEFCKFDQDGNLVAILEGSTVSISPNAPTVQWHSLPPTDSPLSGNMEFSFHAADPDPDTSLWAWVKVSSDGGQTWRSAGTYFQVENSPETFTIQSADWPESEDFHVKLLVSDDGNTTVAQAGPFLLHGFSPDPAAQISMPETTQTFTTDHPLIIPVDIRNTGSGALEVQVQAQTLPDWVRSEPVSPLNIPANSKQTLFLVATLPDTETRSMQVTLETNDPAQSTVTFPVQFIHSSNDAAPDVCWAGLLQGGISEDPVPMPSHLTILARDRFGRDHLHANITVVVESNGQEVIINKAPMTPSGLKGMYSYILETDETMAGQTLAFDFEMHDPLTGLADLQGLNSDGYDFMLSFIRPNNPPRFTALDPDLDENEEVSVEFGELLELSFSLEDPDGDSVDYSLHTYSSLPFNLDTDAGTLRLVMPVLDDYYNLDVSRQSVTLIATDPHGARAVASWPLHIKIGSVNNRAYPYYSSTIIEDDTFLLKAFSNTASEGQYCRVEYRRAGSQNWTLIGESAYDTDHPGVVHGGKLAIIPWDTTSLEPGVAYEVRFRDRWPDGSWDTEPPTVQFYKELTDVEAIPSLSEWGMLILTILMLALGGFYLARIRFDNNQAAWTRLLM